MSLLTEIFSQFCHWLQFRPWAFTASCHVWSVTLYVCIMCFRRAKPAWMWSCWTVPRRGECSTAGILQSVEVDSCCYWSNDWQVWSAAAGTVWDQDAEFTARRVSVPALHGRHVDREQSTGWDVTVITTMTRFSDFTSILLVPKLSALTVWISTLEDSFGSCEAWSRYIRSVCVLCLCSNVDCHSMSLVAEGNVLKVNIIIIKARFPLPELTAWIDGWPVSITRRVDGRAFPHPSTRAIDSGSGNRAYVTRYIYDCWVIWWHDDSQLSVINDCSSNTLP